MKRIILTLGLAARIAVRVAAGGDDARVKKITAQFRNPLFPETKVQFQGWKIEEGKVYYRVIDKETGKPYLNNGLFVYE